MTFRLLLLSMMIQCNSLFAQSFHFTESISGASAQPSYSRNVIDSIGDAFTLNCVNLSSSPKNVKVRMTVLSTPSSCSNDIYFCDPIACYPSTIFLSITSFSIGVGDTINGALVPHIAAGTCCGDYAVNYCLFDVNDPGDSAHVVVNYNVTGNHCFNTVQALADRIHWLLSPNPSSGVMYNSFDLHEIEGSTKLVLFSAEGKIMMEVPLNKNQSEQVIDVSPLSPGIYFCSLRVEEQFLCFKKCFILN